MRITPLSSGSQGNALLVECGRVRLLVDAGLHVDELEARLRAIGVRPKDIDYLFLTHRHKDHIRGSTELCRRWRIRILTTRSTARSLGTECHRLIRRIEPERPVEVGGFQLWAVPVAHDAPETMALLVDDGTFRYGHATDLGSIGGAINDYLTCCDVLFLEFNHDPGLLAAGPYPGPLKRRIGGTLGHLSNEQGAALLRRLAHPRLAHVWLAHLSATNNRPELALAAARAALPLGCTARLAIAAQEQPSPAVDLAVLSLPVEVA
jgi:phosphoribosyl 1,2-cyclic phosphodiesterase